uniref:Uncharacterized protein n=1 Tax=Timema poppense TaxID=170557 RepID=A0A7R9CU84_TIMPO|nr:unnamed protein product [Timema poppensis]
MGLAELQKLARRLVPNKRQTERESIAITVKQSSSFNFIPLIFFSTSSPTSSSILLVVLPGRSLHELTIEFVTGLTTNSD